MFDEKKQIERMTPYVLKLVDYYKNNGINFQDKEGDLDNVIFSNEDSEMKIAYQCFYRFSGVSVIYKNVPDKKGQTKLEAVELTDELFYEIYWKSILNYIFEI